MLAILGTIAGFIIFWGSIIGAIQMIASVRKWFVNHKKCDYLFPETGKMCQQKVLEGSVYCEIHEKTVRANGCEKCGLPESDHGHGDERHVFTRTKDWREIDYETWAPFAHEKREKESNRNGSTNEV